MNYSGRFFNIGHRYQQGVGRTPKIQAISKRCIPFPTVILGLMALIRPGRVGGTEHRIARTARQFYARRDINTNKSKFSKRTYKAGGIPIATMRMVHSRYIDIAVVKEPVLYSEM